MIESVADKSQGPLVRGVLHHGVLHVGQHLVSGGQWGKIRALFDDLGRPVTERLPGQPVQLAGLRGLAVPGDAFFVHSKEKIDEVVEYRQLVGKFLAQQEELAAKQIDDEAAAPPPADPGEEEGEQDDEEGEAGIRVPLVVKAQNVGSLVSLLETLHSLSDPDVTVAIVHSGVGEVTPTDLAWSPWSCTPD